MARTLIKKSNNKKSPITTTSTMMAVFLLFFVGGGLGFLRAQTRQARTPLAVRQYITHYSVEHTQSVDKTHSLNTHNQQDTRQQKTHSQYCHSPTSTKNEVGVTRQLVSNPPHHHKLLDHFQTADFRYTSF
jgi:hypothetical protein